MENNSFYYFLIRGQYFQRRRACGKLEARIVRVGGVGALVEKL